MSLFNRDQEEWMEYLDTLPPEKKCDCGWSVRGTCYGTCYGAVEKGGAERRDKIGGDK